MTERAGGLPVDLVVGIGERLTSIENYGSFRAVCKSWRASTQDNKYLKNKTFGVPWLMLADEEEEDQLSGMRGFFNVASRNICKIFLPETIKKRCLPCQDWLFMVSEDEIHASLFHPVSRAQIHLPPLDTFPDYKRYSLPPNNIHFIRKVVLSANPNSTSDFVVFVLWGRRSQLGYWKPGHTSWTPMEYWIFQIFDMIYYANKLYAVDCESNFVTCDVNGPNPAKLQRISSNRILMDSNAYLVEVSNKLLVVRRYLDKSNRSNRSGQQRRTVGFLISELDLNDGKELPRRNLRNKALFLGHNTSFSVECSNFNNCKPNCVYFSDDNIREYLCLSEGGGKDTGVYNLSDGSLEPLINNIRCSKVTPPTWIGPSF